MIISEVPLRLPRLWPLVDTLHDLSVAGMDAKKNSEAPLPSSKEKAEEPSPSSKDDSSPENPSLFALSLDKLVTRLRERPPKRPDQPLALLVITGAFNPPHRGHLAALEAAAAWVQRELDLEVAGAVLSLSHDTVVRNKLKRTPMEILPPRHRLRLCQESTKKYAWMTVDRWEVTRRAAMDYASVLDHIRETWRGCSAFPVRVFMVRCNEITCVGLSWWIDQILGAD